jgi:hypothetical protein
MPGRRVPSADDPLPSPLLSRRHDGSRRHLGLVNGRAGMRRPGPPTSERVELRRVHGGQMNHCNSHVRALEQPLGPQPCMKPPGRERRCAVGDLKGMPRDANEEPTPASRPRLWRSGCVEAGVGERNGNRATHARPCSGDNRDETASWRALDQRATSSGVTTAALYPQRRVPRRVPLQSSPRAGCEAVAPGQPARVLRSRHYRPRCGCPRP